MKVHTINNNYYNKATNVQNKNISSPNFRALTWPGREKTGNQVNWRGAEDSIKPLSFTQQMLNYGFEALDENTLFITTTNEAKSNYALNQYKDKIGVPILRTYTLDVIPELNKDWSDEIDRNFAFFKKNDEYYILSLASMFGTFLINPKTKEKYDLRPGEVKKLENGTEIQAFISRDSNNKIIFERPSAYRTSNAKKYLDYSTVDPIAHNTRAVSALTSPKSQKADKVNKDFTFADIGGLDDGFFHRYEFRPQMTVVARQLVIALFVLIGVEHGRRTVAVRIRIDRRRSGYNFHYRTRLVNELNCSVHLGFVLGVTEGKRVEIRVRRHRQNRASFRIKNDRPARGGPVFPDSPFKGVFGFELDVVIDGQKNIGAGNWIDRNFPFIIQFAALGIAQSADEARSASKLAVEPQFDSRRTVARGIHRAEHMRKAPAVQILSDLTILDRHAAHKTRVDKRAMGIRVGGYRQQLIPVGRIFTHPLHPTIIKSQRVGYRLDDRLPRSRRFTPATDNRIRQIARIEMILPARHRFDERILSSVRRKNRPATSRQTLLEVVFRSGHRRIEMTSYKPISRITSHYRQQQHWDPEPDILAAHSHGLPSRVTIFGRRSTPALSSRNGQLPWIRSSVRFHLNILIRSGRFHL